MQNSCKSALLVSEVARLTKNRCGRLHYFVVCRFCFGGGVGVCWWILWRGGGEA